MKQMFFALVALFLTSGIAQAQEDGAKLAKSAARALAAYAASPSDNKDKLDEAKRKIEDALKTPEAQALASAWQTKGEIYSTTFDKDMVQRSLKPDAPFSGDNDALESYKGYSKALELAGKKYEKTEALKGLTGVQNGLINMSIFKYTDKEYFKAYESGIAAVQCHDILIANKEKSQIADTSLADRTYFAAYCALLAKKYPEAQAVLESMIKKGFGKEEVYESLVTCKAELGDEAGAKTLLKEAREKFPNNTGLLFAEINYYIKENKLDELTGSLQSAIDKEPNNVSLYLNLGRVYDGLQQRELENKNAAKAVEYLDKAKANYAKAAQIDPKNVDAHYQLGQLFYNRAVLVNQEMAKLGNTNEDLKKYKVLNKEMLDMFEQALPHFQKAESLDANDLNTLIALNEIYVRKEDDLALEFKKRLDTVKGGGKNAAPYFK